MTYYFVRVNGNTGHNNPNKPEAYVSGEPPLYPNTYFNYFEYCLKHDFIRIGWPDVGDLSKGGKAGALANFYSLETVKPHIKNYLLDFYHMPLNSIILMPNKDIPGNLYIGEVNGPYQYFHDTPRAPYECAHRRSVKWDRDDQGQPKLYRATDMKIGIVGGWWLRAFHKLRNSEITDAIDNSRNQ